MMLKTTETDSRYDNLEQMPLSDLLSAINAEDQTVPSAVAKALPQIEILCAHILERMQRGGRLFYIGAGTSGRLGILDASEIPPTFGVDDRHIIGLIAGGDTAIRKAVEFAEDNEEQAWKDLEKFDINTGDCLLGIAASGSTPYVIGGVTRARSEGLVTGCLVCNSGSRLAQVCEFPVEVVVGPEFVTGSTRMKSGTAQKLVLNMISTSLMIRLGRVRGNKMVDMKLSNTKLLDRGSRMVQAETGLSDSASQELLAAHGNVRAAIDAYRKNNV